MDSDTIKLVTVMLQAALQVFCIGLAVCAIRSKHTNGDRSFWVWFASGFAFQLVRRLLYIALLTHNNFPEMRFLTFIVVPTGVSVCYAIAMFKAFKYINSREEEVNNNRETITLLQSKLENLNRKIKL